MVADGLDGYAEPSRPTNYTLWARRNGFSIASTVYSIPLICGGRKEITIEKELGKISVHYWCAHSSMNICSLSVITHEENRTLLVCTYGSVQYMSVARNDTSQCARLAFTLGLKRLNAV